MEDDPVHVGSGVDLEGPTPGTDGQGMLKRLISLSKGCRCPILINSDDGRKRQLVVYLTGYNIFKSC